MLDSLLSGNFKSFKESVTSLLYGKIGSRLEDAKAEIASGIFGEEKESSDVEFKEKVNHADEDGYPDKEDDDEEDENKGGEYLVDVKMIGGVDTELKNFRVIAVNKKDVESRLNGFFGKGKFEIQNIKLSEEKIDEISQDTLRRYKSHAEHDADWHSQQHDDPNKKNWLGPQFPNGTRAEVVKYHKDKVEKREKGIASADARLNDIRNNQYTSGRKYRIGDDERSKNFKKPKRDWASEMGHGVFGQTDETYEKGQDIGKPGLNFKKIATKAGAEYGSKEAGQRVAGAILKKILKKKVTEDVIMEATANSLEKSKFGSAHSGGIHYSKIGGKDTEWNYVGKDKNGKNVVTTNRDDAHSILHKGKLLSLYKPEEEKIGQNFAPDKDLSHLFGKTKKVSEDVVDEERIDELKASTLGSYIGKSKASEDRSEYALDKEHENFPKKPLDQGKVDRLDKNIEKRSKGRHAAIDKLRSGNYQNESSVEAGNPPEEMPFNGFLKKIGTKAKKLNTGPKDVDDAVKETGKVKQNESTNMLQNIAKVAQSVEECSTYTGDYDYKNEEKDKEYATSHDSFSDAIEHAKKHALGSGYKHDPLEFDDIVNQGFIKPTEKKTHAFHMSLHHKDTGKEAINKIHNFQITGSGDGKFGLTQDIK